ncbi:AraC family transcriptional regulator [Paenibacillus sp. MWE-103]|uniref:AraC family transcriptional regulator n=2 Tax=Paenibacillus artemisiicola TaxID=1172618 RepID=A0ABS3W882_9BACL|nr:AraC family transcriptional regulator [Paenibacillus artemisiicola]
MPPIPVVMAPAFCLVLQGAKKLQAGQAVMNAGPGSFLASLVDLPGFAQVDGATPDSPYIGLRMDFTTDEIAAVMAEAGIQVKPRDAGAGMGAFVGRADAALLRLFARLLRLHLEKPEAEARFLASLLKREMMYHLLTGDDGHLFIQRALFDRQEGIGPVIAWIKTHFTRPFAVEELAKSFNMSASGLHHKFKAVTGMGPLRYQKQLRLQEARRLMLGGTADATNAAAEVGYESLSQFTREYRRLFGRPPLQDIKALQAGSAANALAELLSASRGN